MDSGKTTVDKRDELLTALAELPTEAQQDEFLASHPDLLSPEIVTQLTEAVRTQACIDASRALLFAKAALTVARGSGDRASIARSSRAMANALYANGKNKEALEFYDRALESFEADANLLEIGITLSSSLQPSVLIGDYDRAFRGAERARAIFSELGNERRLARLDINVGNILHRQDRFEEALSVYERAYSSLVAGSDQDKDAIAAVLSNLAVCLIALNDFPRALATYRQAREFCKQNGLALLADQADYNVAWLYYLRGEYGHAIQILLATREECRKNKDIYQLGLCYLDLSEIYLELHLSEEAGANAREGCRLFEENGNGYEGAKCKANEAIALAQQGKAFRAIELFAKARKAFVAEKNAVWPYLIDLYQAFVLLEEGRLFEARRFCTSAKSFFAESTLQGKAVLCDLILARIALRAGELPTAEQECREALERLPRGASATLSHQVHSLMGQIQHTANRIDAAYASFQNARTALELSRSNLRGEELKIAFLRNKLMVYESLAEITLEKNAVGAPEEVFSYVEEAKSRALMDLLTQGSPAVVSSDTGKSDLVRQIRSLREELNWYYHRIDIEELRAEEKSAERVEKLQQEARRREEEFLRVLREMQAAGENELEGSQRVPLSAIRSSLPDSAMLIEYFTLGDRVIACTLSEDSLEVTAVTVASRVVKLIHMLQFQISQFRLGTKNSEGASDSLLQAMRAHLSELYGELIAPIREKLVASHLVIVPHGSLHYVPFHALHDGAADLIESFTISYAPSGSLFSICQERAAIGGTCSLVLGASEEPASGIPDEAHSVAEILPSARLLLGRDASLDALQTHGPQCRFIHVATQGQFRQDNPLFSTIRLGEDRVNLYDLYQLQMPADLVTLTGCATRMSPAAGGDELLGLVRGLLYAGARRLLLTLWENHREDTTQFMNVFYGKCGAERSAAIALREAMLEIRERQPHPCHWAPFFLVGKIS